MRYSRKARGLGLALVGLLVGMLLITPAAAHFTQNTRHLGVHAWNQVIRARADARYVSRTAPVVRFIDLPTTAANLGANASLSTGFGSNAGVTLAAAGNSTINLNFTVPPNYRQGTAMQLRFVWHTPSTNCDVAFRSNHLSHARPGIQHPTGPGVTSGLTAVGGETLEAGAVPNISGAKQFRITAPNAGTPIAAGDAISFGVFRAGDAAADTCAGVARIQGIRILYQSV